MSTGVADNPSVTAAAGEAAGSGPASSASASRAQVDRIKGESLLLTASYGLTALIGVAFWTVAARTESLAILGLSTAVISAFTAAAVIAGTGVSNAFLAMIPIAGRAQGALLRHGYIIVATTSLFTGAIAGAIAAFAVPNIGSPGWTMATITIVSVLWGLFVVQDSVLIAFGKARWLLYENGPVSVLKLIMLPVLAVVVGQHGHPVIIATAVPAVIAVVIVTGIFVPRLVRTSRADRDADPDAATTTVEEWMGQHRREFQFFAVRDGAASAMNLGLFMFLPFLVTATAGREQGAIFALSLPISNAMDLFTAGVGMSLTTTAASDHRAAPVAARMMWQRLFRIDAVVAVAVIAGAPILLRAFGTEYLSNGGWYVVVILVASSLMRTTFEVWTALLRALRRTGVLLAWTTLTSSALLVGVIVGGLNGGAVGAAIGIAGATVVSSTVGALGLGGKIGSRPPRPTFTVDTRTAWPWDGREPAPTEGVNERAGWFGPQDRPRFGWFSLPTSGVAATGVVLCPPIGEEARSSHRAFRRLGVELARQGLVALRVDYDGTGDSAGGQRDPDRVQSWKASITDAADELRAMGLHDIALVGMRIGATLAAEVAAEGGFGSVVLWDPCASGRGFVREGQALHALGDHGEPAPTDGSVHTPGFAYDAPTVAALGKVSLSSLPVEAWCTRLLVLTRNGKPPAGAAGTALTGGHVEWGVAAGQPELIGVEPNMAVTPLPVLEQITGWIAAGSDDARSAPFEMSARCESVQRDPRSGRLIRERIVTLGPNKLFGIVCEPLRPRAAAPLIAMINVAIEIHLGPGRRWVDYSRTWAALGLRCVRFDQSGLGDSPGRAGQREDVIFDGNWVEDVADAIDAMDTGDAPVAAFGLCSGAYSAFEAALRRQLDAVYVIAPVTSIPQMARGEAAFDPRRRAARPFIRPLAKLFQRNTMAAHGLWRLYRQFAVWHAPMSVANDILRTGAAVRILANRKDAEGYREVVWWSVVRRRTYKRVGLRVLPELDHALMGQRSQDLTYADATRFWLDRYGTASGSALVLPLGGPPDIGVA